MDFAGSLGDIWLWSDRSVDGYAQIYESAKYKVKWGLRLININFYKFKY